MRSYCEYWPIIERYNYWRLIFVGPSIAISSEKRSINRDEVLQIIFGAARKTSFDDSTNNSSSDCAEVMEVVSELGVATFEAETLPQVCRLEAETLLVQNQDY